MKEVKITIAQVKSFHGDIEKNLQRAEEIIKEASENKSNIVVFPELYYTGYFNRRVVFHELAEYSYGNLYKRLKEMAIKYNICIGMGYTEKEDESPEKIFNTIMFVTNKGELGLNYRKICCWKDEKRAFTEGDKLSVCETEFGNIGVISCYDAEFPELFRGLALKGADLVFCPSVWSKWIVSRWDLSLKSGAATNLMYVVGVNNVGLTPAGKEICGDSKIISPMGDVLAQCSSTEEEILHFVIDIDEVKKIRETYPIWDDYKPSMNEM